MPENVRTRTLETWREGGLALEHVIQGLHSGRIMGLEGILQPAFNKIVRVKMSDENKHWSGGLQ